MCIEFVILTMEWEKVIKPCKMIRNGLLFLSVFGTAMLFAGMPDQVYPGGLDVAIGVNVFSWFVAIIFMAFVDCSAKDEAERKNG